MSGWNRTEALTRPESSEWVRKFARVGYAAKGVVYGLVGVLAMLAAFGEGGQLGGGAEAARYVDRQPFGQVLLTAIGVGLLGYVVWRIVQAVKDPERDSHGGENAALRRSGYVLSALMNGSVAITALQLASGSGGQGGGTSTWAASALSKPFGQFLLGAAALVVLMFAAAQLYKAYTGKFVRNLQLHGAAAQARQTIVRMSRFGVAARAVVFSIVGIGLMSAAIHHNAGEAKDFGGALSDIGSSTFGQVLLIVVAAGLAAYGAYMLISAKYRRLGGAAAH